MTNKDMGFDVGYDLGTYYAYRQAQAAYDLGEIELWLEYHKPKSIEDWGAWELEHGTHDDFLKRWDS